LQTRKNLERLGDVTALPREASGPVSPNRRELPASSRIYFVEVAAV